MAKEAKKPEYRLAPVTISRTKVMKEFGVIVGAEREDMQTAHTLISYDGEKLVKMADTIFEDDFTKFDVDEIEINRVWMGALDFLNVWGCATKDSQE